jgi:hypothetical protein
MMNKYEVAESALRGAALAYANAVLDDTGRRQMLFLRLKEAAIDYAIKCW